MLPPPPAYSCLSHSPTSSSPASSLTGLLTLPQHLLLSILSHLPLPSLVFSLRATCRTLHLLATSLTRQQVVTSFHQQVQQRGHTTAAGSLWDVSQATGGNVLQSRSRETAVLDLWASTLALAQLRNSESTLLQQAEGDSSAGQDLFDFLQPKARVEDLVIEWGREDQVIYLEGGGAGEGGGTVLGTDVTVQLGRRSAKLLLPFRSSVGAGGRVRTVERAVVEVGRAERDSLEVVADRLVKGLKVVRVWREEKEGKGWYETG
jgi:hypothetical protein